MKYYFDELPSVADCHAFMGAINAGREAIGESPLEKLEYDECEPGSSTNCLSAHHLFSLLDNGGVSTATVGPIKDGLVNEALENALGTQTDSLGRLEIPPEILRVTDYFDNTSDSLNRWQELRDVMVEAGLVDD